MRRGKRDRTDRSRDKGPKGQSTKETKAGQGTEAGSNNKQEMENQAGVESDAAATRNKGGRLDHAPRQHAPTNSKKGHQARLERKESHTQGACATREANAVSQRCKRPAASHTSGEHHARSHDAAKLSRSKEARLSPQQRVHMHEESQRRERKHASSVRTESDNHTSRMHQSRSQSAACA